MGQLHVDQIARGEGEALAVPEMMLVSLSHPDDAISLAAIDFWEALPAPPPAPHT